MVCSRCAAARQAASRAIGAAASGRLIDATREARTAAQQVAAKISENDRIRSITRRKPHG
jgi:hypothetical protein